MEQENYDLLLTRFEEIESKLKQQEERLKDMIDFNKSLLNQKEVVQETKSNEDLEDKLKRGLRI